MNISEKKSKNRNDSKKAVSSSPTDAREAALKSLMRCFDKDKFSNIEVDAAITRYHLEGNEKALFTLLVYGVIERKLTLDYIIGKFSSKPTDKLESIILMILRLGAYQIIYCDKIPDSAACSQSVELAKKLTHSGTSGFVNGVLRSVARNKDNIEYPDPVKDRIAYLSVFYSCPEWMCRLFCDSYGYDRCVEILKSSVSNPTITLRANTLKTSRDKLIQMLPESAVCERAPHGIRLTDSTPLSKIPEISEGLCFVQDEASQLCTYAVGAKPGETVIDACSCPGGKSFGIAMDMLNKGKLLSLDIHANKLSLVRSGAERLGITIIETGEQDASVLKSEYIAKADRVLCDVPCSGLGVLAKKPDLRYKQQNEIIKLPDIQYKIIDNCCRYVKKGGSLIYSTCTLNPAENENVINKFISNHPEFKPDEALIPDNKSYITIFPKENGGDGFFIAKFIKN